MTAAAAEVPKPQTQTKPQPQPAVKSVSPVVPIKVGFFGGQGAGKTTSAAMLRPTAIEASATTAAVIEGLRE